MAFPAGGAWANSGRWQWTLTANSLIKSRSEPLLQRRLLWNSTRIGEYMQAWKNVSSADLRDPVPCIPSPVRVERRRLTA